MTAAENIQEALSRLTEKRGWRGPDGERQMVMVRSADLQEVCTKVSEPDAIVEALAKGTAPKARPGEWVTVQADDAFHVLEKAGQQPQHAAMRPAFERLEDR